MYKILIVDDERMIRLGIEKTIQWEKLKIGQVFTAASAQQAINIIRENHPDIMITDINMTEMSGLDLIGELKDHDQGMRIIILTGYERFEYARKALQLQVHDFLLKPIDEQELSESIRRQVEALDEINEKNARLFTVNRTEGVMQQEQLETVMRDYVHGKLPEQDKEEEFLRKFHFAKDQDMRIGIVIPDRKSMDLDSDDEKFYIQTIRQICMNLIDECEKGITFMDRDEHILLAFFSKISEDIYENSKENAEQLMDVLENECGGKPKLILGSEVKGFRNLQVSYNDALHVLKNERKDFADIFYNQAESRKNDIFQDIFREFKQAMVENFSNIDEVIHILKRFQTAAESYNLGRKYAVNCYFELASAIYFAYMNETGNTPEESLNSFSRSLVGIDKDKAEEVTEMFLQKILSKEEGDEHEIIRKVKNIVHEDLSQDLTVANLAAKLYVTPNYLSRLFKKITGEGCNEYIVRKRIEKAKSLLETTTLKTGEIATIVGYHDMNYFSLAFKKHTGQSPTKYRNSVQK